jgi:ABC-2 type transport system ATP-binding protein
MRRRLGNGAVKGKQGMLELEAVTKLYGSVIGVNDISLTLTRGAFGLVGPNGSGKSTMLNLITGQLRPTIGRVRVLGESPWNNANVLRQIGMCPEQDVLYPNVTGLEWVRYLLELRGWRSQAATARATEMLELVGLGAAMQRRMGGYSRGMRQRAKLAQAIAHDPQLLILDEPFNGLDPVGRHAIADVLHQWIAKGRGLILASHVLHEVESVTDSFLLICHGRLLASGSIPEVKSLLAEVPNEISVRCDRPHELACLLVGEKTVDSVRIADDGAALLLSTRNPAVIFARLPEWISDAGIRVHEMRCADDSLHSLFHSLLQIHRGHV